jgi:hypothetical protein
MSTQSTPHTSARPRPDCGIGWWGWPGFGTDSGGTLRAQAACLEGRGYSVN